VSYRRLGGDVELIGRELHRDGPGGGIPLRQVSREFGNGGLIEDCPNNVIGGTSTAVEKRHLGQPGSCVLIPASRPPTHAVASNIIGLTSSGAAVLGNSGEGVGIFSARNVSARGT